MGTSSSAAQLAAKFGQAAVALSDAEREGVREAGIVAKAIFIAELPTRRMSGVGRSGAKLGARFTQPKGSPPYTVVSFTGPVHLLNNRIGRHLIGPKGWRRARGAKGRLKFTGGDGEIRSGVVLHPGVAGKKFAPNAARKAAAAAPKQIEMATGRALRKVF